MIRWTYMFTVLAFGIVLTAVHGDDKPADKPFDDTTFVKMAANGGMAEVELGKIGSERAKSAQVKKFADQLVLDHTKANNALKYAAKAAGIEIPTTMDDKQKQLVEKFKNYKGDDFDREYVKHMVKDHMEDIELFIQASKEAKSNELKTFAVKTLPVLNQHLDMAKKLDK